MAVAETLEDAARRIGVSVATLERRIRKAQAAIRKARAWPKGPASLLPDYDPGSLVAKRDGISGKWAFHSPTPKKGRPRKKPPIALAVEARERAILAAIGVDRRGVGRAKASRAGVEANKAKARINPVRQAITAYVHVLLDAGINRHDWLPRIREHLDHQGLPAVDRTIQAILTELGHPSRRKTA